MKFIKHILLLLIYVGVSQNAEATSVSGYGCNLGNRIYVNKIGTTTFWGDTFDVYSSNGANYPIDWNNTSQCDKINTNAVVDQNKACWVSSYVNPPNNNSGISHGAIVYYTMQTCSVDLPLDDYIWLLVISVAGLGAYIITRKGLLPT